jgi:hypothetical protein
MVEAPFSVRHGFVELPGEITVRYEAPPDFRYALLALAERADLSWAQIVQLLTNVLLVAPEGNWGAPYLREEAQRKIDDAPWAKVYDVAEAIYIYLSNWPGGYDRSPSHWFEQQLNRFFEERGYGWQMVNGAVEFRGPAPVEQAVQRAIGSLDQTNRGTASRELREAHHDLSRRPAPDTTGAVQHALAALECLARDLTGDPRPTFGTVLDRNPGLFPPPLDAAMHKLWGYASEQGRHLREGRTPTTAEAVLVLGLVSAAASFLLERGQSPS